MFLIRRPKYRRVALWIFLTLIAGSIFFFSVQDNDQSHQLSNGLLSMLDDWLGRWVALLWQRPLSLSETQYVFRKMAHFVEFALLGFFALLLLREYHWRKPALTSWLLCTIYAVSDELHQLLSDGRTPSLRDVGIDAAGALLGIMLASVLVRLLRRILHR